MKITKFRNNRRGGEIGENRILVLLRVSSKNFKDSPRNKIRAERFSCGTAHKIEILKNKSDFSRFISGSELQQQKIFSYAFFQRKAKNFLNKSGISTEHLEREKKEEDKIDLEKKEDQMMRMINKRKTCASLSSAISREYMTRWNSGIMK